MDKEKENFMENIFDRQLKNYLELEKTIYEAMAMYEETRDDKIKYILQKNIFVAKNEIFILIEFISHFVSLKNKDHFENKIYEKLENLKEIEREITGLNKQKQ